MYMCAQLLSQVRLFVTPWNAGYQGPLFMGFTRQEYWSGLLFSSPADLPDPRIEPASPALAGRFFTTAPPEKPWTRPHTNSRRLNYSGVIVSCTSPYIVTRWFCWSENLMHRMDICQELESYWQDSSLPVSYLFQVGSRETSFSHESYQT